MDFANAASKVIVFRFAFDVLLKFPSYNLDGPSKNFSSMLFTLLFIACYIRFSLQHGPLAQLAEQLTLNQ